MRNSKILLYTLFLISIGCKKSKYFAGPNFFQDDFETYSSLGNLLPGNDIYWSFTQITRDGNKIVIDSSFSHSGKKSLKFTAQKSDAEGASKASIAKQKMAFWEGETVRLSGWYFVQKAIPSDWLFLMDLEEQTAIGAGPGMRLVLVNNQLRVEYKFNENDILQLSNQEKEFPREQWVHIIWEIKLSQKNTGTVKVWQDGNLIIDSKNNTTLPKDILYFQQGTKGMYSSCEIGITANSKDQNLSIWVDDIKFETIK